MEAAKSDPKWAFSDNKQLAGALQEGLSELKTKLTSSGVECIVVQEAKELKSGFEEDELLGLMERFLTLGPTVSDLEKQHNKLLALYK
eukprot:634777-Alexandrium_andersonii.AAC.1